MIKFQGITLQSEEGKTGEGEANSNLLKATQGEIMKTTIYRPALMRGVNESNNIINKISNFVEDIRISTTHQNTPVQE